RHRPALAVLHAVLVVGRAAFAADRHRIAAAFALDLFAAQLIRHVVGLVARWTGNANGHENLLANAQPAEGSAEASRGYEHRPALQPPGGSHQPLAPGQNAESEAS